jgi:hypothetical protein
MASAFQILGVHKASIVTVRVQSPRFWEMFSKMVVLWHHGVKMKNITMKRDKMKQICCGNSGNAPSTQEAADLIWRQSLEFRNMELFSNFQGLSHNLLIRSVKKNYFILFVDRPFCKMVEEETNKHSHDSSVDIALGYGLDNQGSRI